MQPCCVEARGLLYSVFLKCDIFSAHNGCAVICDDTRRTLGGVSKATGHTPSTVFALLKSFNISSRATSGRLAWFPITNRSVLGLVFMTQQPVVITDIAGTSFYPFASGNPHAVQLMVALLDPLHLSAELAALYLQFHSSYLKLFVGELRYLFQKL
jgi:hypothetical protein